MIAEVPDYGNDASSLFGSDSEKEKEIVEETKEECVDIIVDKPSVEASEVKNTSIDNTQAVEE